MINIVERFVNFANDSYYQGLNCELISVFRSIAALNAISLVLILIFFLWNWQQYISVRKCLKKTFNKNVFLRCFFLLQKTELIFQDGSELEKLVKQFPCIRTGYRPTIWCFSSALMMIVPFLLQRRIEPSYEKYWRLFTDLKLTLFSSLTLTGKYWPRLMVASLYWLGQTVAFLLQNI